MLNVADYIKLILKKRKWNNSKLCEELNKIELKLGDSKTVPQNITNYLNGLFPFRPKILAKYEVVLGLKPFTLINMVEPLKTRESQKELKEIMKKLNEVKQK